MSSIEIKKFDLPEKFDLDLLQVNYQYRKYIKTIKIDITENPDIDLKWLKKQSDYICKGHWKTEQFLSVYSYMINGKKIVDSYICKNYDNCLKEIEECFNTSIQEQKYFPLFFPIIDIIYSNTNEEILKDIDDYPTCLFLNNLRKEIDNICSGCYMPYKNNYYEVLEIFSRFTDKIKLVFVKQYIKTMSNFIKSSPSSFKEMLFYIKTSEKIYLFDRIFEYPYFTIMDFTDDNMDYLKIIRLDSRISAIPLILFSKHQSVIIDRNSKFEIIKTLDSNEEYIHDINFRNRTIGKKYSVLKIIK